MNTFMLLNFSSFVIYLKIILFNWFIRRTSFNYQLARLHFGFETTEMLLIYSLVNFNY